MAKIDKIFNSLLKKLTIEELEQLSLNILAKCAVVRYVHLDDDTYPEILAHTLKTGLRDAINERKARDAEKEAAD